jgi:hypothetical protein
MIAWWSHNATIGRLINCGIVIPISMIMFNGKIAHDCAAEATHVPIQTSSNPCFTLDITISIKIE